MNDYEELYEELSQDYEELYRQYTRILAQNTKLREQLKEVTLNMLNNEDYGDGQ